MAIRVETLPDRRTVEVAVSGPIRAGDLLRMLRDKGITWGEAVVILEGRPLPEDALVPDGSKVTVVRVLSGGGS